MRHEVGNIFSVCFSVIKLSFMKLFHWKTLSFSTVERISPNVVIDMDRTSTLKLKDKVSIHSGSRITIAEGGKVEIGKRVRINNNCRIACRDFVKIEDKVEIGPNVLLYDHDHDFKCTGGLDARAYKKAPVHIGNGAWIGAGTIILRGTNIGNNCVIAAGSVLKGNYPDDSLIVQKRTDTIIKYNNDIV